MLPCCAVEGSTSLYTNKLVYVTGASEGIGKAIAKGFVRAGAHVLLYARSPAKLAVALQEIDPLRVHQTQIVVTQSLDVMEAQRVATTFTAHLQEYGVPEVVVNCAGFARPGYLHELDLTHYHAMMDLNYFSIVNVCKALVPAMMATRRGYIVNTASMAGFIGLFGYTGYCASKYAVVGFSEALRRELEPYHITVSVLCPPNTRTPGLHEENKYKPSEVLATEERVTPVEPEYVAQQLLKALPKKPFMIVPTFDGAMAYRLSRYAPALLHRFVRRRPPEHHPR
jgi:3-dehydrosphinganine reductase